MQNAKVDFIEFTPLSFLLYYGQVRVIMDTYRATNTLNGKFYIGSSVNFERRKREHLSSKETYLFQTDLRKNPEAFIWEVYTDNLDTNEHEVRLLKESYFDVRCYNLNSCAERPPSPKGKTWWKNELIQKQKMCFEKPEGAGWGRGRLQKTKKKISVPKTEETKKKISKANSGKTRTEAQNKANSERNSGEKNPNYNRTGALHPLSKAIIAIEPDGTQRHFGSIHEAARELGMEQSNLSGRYLKPDYVPKGKWKGWQFFFKNSESFSG